MKKPSTRSKITSIVVLIVLISGALTLGAGLRWAAARSKAAETAAQGCTLNCTATVPATGQVGSSVPFASTATPSDCAGAPSFEWNFGDNTPASTDQNPSHVYTGAGTYNWSLTTRVSGGGSALIETVAGGLGEGNQAGQVSFATLTAVARDPQGRGIYVAETTNAGSLIRFINLGNASVTIAGVTIAPGVVRLVAGGGLDPGDNVPGQDADLGSVTGLAVSPDSRLLYFTDAIGRLVRALNLSGSPVTLGGLNIGPNNVGTIASAGFGSNLNGMSVNPSNGNLYVADATPGVNKVFLVSLSGTVTTVAGNSAATPTNDPLPSPPVSATEVPLLQPRAVKADGAGNVFIADTGHGRIVRVDPGGDITLVAQFQTGPVPPNPFPSGLAMVGSNLFTANGNSQTVVRVMGGMATVAGTAGTACEYSASNCGDGGPGTQAGLNMLSSINTPPLAGIESDGNGLFILDQGGAQRSRVRYLNLGASVVTLAGVAVGPNQINTIAGAGLRLPYDNGLATSASLNTPVGVAADAQGNLFIADTASNRLRFVNRSASAVTIFAGTAAAQTVGPGQIVTVNKDVGPGPGDGVPVNSAFFDTPQGLAATAQGIFVADSKRGPNVPPTFQGRRTGLIRFVNTTGVSVTFYPSSSSPVVVPPGHIMAIAGGGIDPGSIGNGGFAPGARLLGPSDIAVNPMNGDLYIADVGNRAVRQIDRNTGIITSLSLPAAQYTGLGFDASGRLHVVNNDANTLLRETSPDSGTFTTLASGLNRPRDVAFDAAGNAYVTNGGNHRIARITATGAVSVFAGTTIGFAGDGGSPANARLNLTTPLLVLNSTTTVHETVGIAAGPSGDLFFTDSSNHRIRRLSLSGGGVITCSRAGTITIGVPSNPSPTIASLNPAVAAAGGAAFTLTVNGSNFIAGSVVRWNGSNRTTNFVSGTELTAAIPASDIATAGTASLTVFNPAPGGGVSNTATFTINNPAPAIGSLSPNQATAGGAAFTLTVNGSNFVNGSVVRWNGADRQTTFGGVTQLTAAIPASDIAAAGTANVTVFNPAPGGGLSNALPFTIGQQPTARVLRVVNASGAPGSAVSVPIELVSQGDENALGFSLSYPPETLGNPQAAPGADATGAMLNVNTGQTAQGRLGIILAQPAGQRFAAGVRQIVVVTFTIAANAAAGPAAINFADQPIAREIADANAGGLPANYVSGAVTVVLGFEGDVSPRPGGSGSITISDWVQLGRFAAGLDTPAVGSEFQRADCAPRNTLGNGSITLSDWVQGGRYAAGLDPITPAGGPTMPATAVQQAAGSEQTADEKQARAARRVWAATSSGELNSTTVYIGARGDENAVSFSLEYDPALLRFAGAELSRELDGATLLINIRQLASGRAGLMLALPAGQSLRAGAIALLTVRFTMSTVGATGGATGGSPAIARVSFGDQPIARAAADVYGRPVASTYGDALVAANARASASVSAASFISAALTSEAIVAAFGDGLATATQIAGALPLPLELVGTRVTVRDSAGDERQAPLFFASHSQVNYLMPAETAAGVATVSITSGNGTVFIEAVEILPVAPGLFAANGDGQGVAAAVALRVKADGSTSYEPVAQFDGAQGRYVASPVELGGEDDRVYLLLFGTGIRSAPDFGSLETVRVTIGGVDAQVTYAGAQGGFAGLEQVNLLLPRSLAGRGEMDVTLMVDGRVANTVRLHVR